MARSNTTARPGILDPPAHDVERVGPHSLAGAGNGRDTLLARPATTAAAAPSPKMAVATIAAGSSLSRRMAIEQVSMVTNSQRLPGSAAARRAAVARPLTPPAQPIPKIGTRRTSVAKADRRAVAGLDAGRGDAGGRNHHHAVDVATASVPPARSPAWRLRGTRRRMHPDRAGCVPSSHDGLRTSRSARRCGAGQCRHCRTRPPAGRTAPCARRTAREPWLSRRVVQRCTAAAAVASERRPTLSMRAFRSPLAIRRDRMNRRVLQAAMVATLCAACQSEGAAQRGEQARTAHSPSPKLQTSIRRGRWRSCPEAAFR